MCLTHFGPTLIKPSTAVAACSETTSRKYMALPKGNFQLSVVEIELTRNVYAWVGQSAALFERPGGMQQVFLPYLGDRGQPGTSSNARAVHTYWLRF